MEIGILYSTFIFVLIVGVTLFKGVKIVPQGSKWVIQRLGKFHSTLTPGLNFIIPYFDRVAHKVTTKDIVLDIALRLADKLADDDKFSVFLTRDSDTTLLLDERAEIANNSGGEMFVSIHANWFEKSSAKGSQTFFLATALNDAARATAMLENKSLQVTREGEPLESMDELSLILFDLLQTEYLEESQSLATEVQTEMVKNLETRDRGVDQAGFFVLNQVYMPSVLVEVAFISNKYEETLLNKESFREKAAQGIYRGIKNFIDKYSPER